MVETATRGTEKKSKMQTLEEMIGNGIFAFNGPDPNRRYDDIRAVSEMHAFLDAEKYCNDVKKAQGNINPGLRKDIIKSFFGPQYEPYGLQLPELLIRDLAKRGLESIEKSTAMHVENNWFDYMDSIGDSENAGGIFKSLIDNGLAYRIDGHDEHNEIIDALWAFRDAKRVAKALEEGDASADEAVQKLLMEDAKKRKDTMPEWGFKLLRDYMYDPTFRSLLFKDYIQRKAFLADQALRKSNGEFDTERAREIVEDSWREAWRLYRVQEDAVNEGKGSQKVLDDMRDDILTPLGVMVAKANYGAARPRYDEEAERTYSHYDDEVQRLKNRNWAGLREIKQDVEEEFPLN